MSLITLSNNGMSKDWTPGPWTKTETKAGKGKVVDADGFSVANTTAGTSGSVARALSQASAMIRQLGETT